MCMGFNSLILYFSYVVLTFFSLWVVIKYKGHGLFKAFFIPFALVLAVSTYFTIESIKGTPIKISSIAQKFRLHAVIISKETNQIFLWLSKPDSVIPVAYVLPYSEETRRRLRKAQMKLKKGFYVLIDTKKFKRPGMVEEGVFLEYNFKGSFPYPKENQK